MYCSREYNTVDLEFDLNYLEPVEYIKYALCRACIPIASIRTSFDIFDRFKPVGCIVQVWGESVSIGILYTQSNIF